MYYVYFLISKNNPAHNYVGFSVNVRERLQKHNNGDVLSTKPYAPWKLVFYEVYENKKDAKRREKYLKTTKGRKAIKLMLQETLKEYRG